MRTSFLVLSIGLALAPLAASAQSAPRDRVAFGSSAHVAPGEVVQDAVSFGGDTIVEGEVLGDAVSFGGSVELRGDGRVHGDVASFGGNVLAAGHGVNGDAASFGGDVRGDAGSVNGEVASFGSGPASHVARHEGFFERVGRWLSEAARSAVAHVLLFLLGLVLIGVWRDRLGALQVTMIKDGVKTAGIGLFAYVAAGIAVVLFALTIVGIPVAVVLALALPVATYVGLAAAATVIGAALPLPQLKDSEVSQLAAGVAVLFVASIVPVVGTIATVVAACLGFGALVRTRFEARPPKDLPEDGGPYRTPSPA